MDRDYMRQLANLLMAANRKFKTGELSEAAEALKAALDPRGEDIDLELAARVLDGMFHEGFLIVCPKRVIFLHKQPIGGLWHSKSWPLTKIRAVDQDGPGGFSMSVEEDGGYKRLKFFIDVRDYSRLTNFVESLDERTQ